MTSAPIPVILAVDVEPDLRVVDPSLRAPWRGYEQCERLLADWRERIQRATTGTARFSWYFRMDPQVAVSYGRATWAVDHYARQVRASLEHGDEIGLHPHAWRWDDRRQAWVGDHGDADWVEHCVGVSMDAYRAAFGRRCRSLRYGDRFMSTRLARFIESQGIEYDLTVEPGEAPRPSLVPSELHTGSIPDYRQAPRMPYRQAPDDFLAGDAGRERGMWTIPLSSAKAWPGLFGAWRKQALPVDAPSCRVGTRYDVLRLWQPPRQFRTIVNRVLTETARPYLAMAIRSDLPLWPVVANAQRNMDYLLRHPLASRFQFCTPAEMMMARSR